MRIDKDNIEEILEMAIRERGAMERMEALDRQMAAETAASRSIRTWITSVAAACVLLVACGDATLRLRSRSVGYGYEFSEVSRGARSGSIENLLDSKEFSKAYEEIQSAREETGKELANPSYDDPDYLSQLNTDLQELDFMEAIGHLRQGKFFKARKELKAIAGAEGTFAEDAESLLRKML